ncbi:MAG TPA: hypothetical protein EYQ27_05405, partial [Gemmatimonadetes bacterium]|nr:hypothetical protein [Gemmatimonadota bacterium]
MSLHRDPIHSVEDVQRLLTESTGTHALLRCLDICIRADQPDLRLKTARVAHSLASEREHEHLAETTRAYLNSVIGLAADLHALPAQLVAGAAWLKDYRGQDPSKEIRALISKLSFEVDEFQKHLSGELHEDRFHTLQRLTRSSSTLRSRFRCPRPALELAERVLVLDPGSSYGLVQRGACRIDLDMIDEGIDDLRRVLDADQFNLYARSSLGRGLHRRGGPSDLEESFQLSLGVFGEDPSVMNARRLRSIARSTGNADAIHVAETRIADRTLGFSRQIEKVLRLDNRFYEGLDAKDLELIRIALN